MILWPFSSTYFFTKSFFSTIRNYDFDRGSFWRIQVVNVVLKHIAYMHCPKNGRLFRGRQIADILALHIWRF